MQQVGCLPSFRTRTQGISGTAIGTSGLDFIGNQVGIGATFVSYCQTELRRTVANSPFNYIQDGATVNEQPGVRTAKFVINYLTLRHEIKNTSSTPAHLILYELQLRPGGPRASKSASTSQNWIHPTSAWENGLYQARQGTTNFDVVQTTAARNTIFQKPFDSNLFCRMYKVFKTTKLLLQAGQTHVHTVTIKPKMMFPLWPGDLVTGAIETIDHYWGQETMTMFVMHGVPVHDKGTMNVTTNSASFDCVTKASCSYQLYDKAMRNWHQFSYLAAGPFTQLRTTEEDSGLPTDLPAEA